MKISREAWDLKEECFGPLLPYVKDQQVTDINYNGTDVWIEHLKYGIRKAPVNLTPEFAGRFSVLISNIVSEQINKFNNVLEAETDTLRISIIHPSVTNTGYSISIRKTPAVMRMTEEKMLADGYCSREVLLFLRNCMEAKLNMVFCGCPGAGKTELLKFLTQFIPKHEKVMTIEDNLEIHYRDINPGANCVELKVDEEFFSYTKAIKSALRQNPQWVLLSEARSTEVKYLLECFSTGLHGLTTLHTDDTRKIPDRIQNMMQDSYAASRMENDIYSFLNVGILLCKKATGNGKVFRFVDQICLFDRIGEENRKYLIVENGKVVSRELDHKTTYKGHTPVVRRNSSGVVLNPSETTTQATTAPSTVDGMPDGYVPSETTAASTTVAPNATTAANHTTAAPSHSAEATTAATTAASPAPVQTTAAATTTAAENGGPGDSGDVVIPVKPD